MVNILTGQQIDNQRSAGHCIALLILILCLLSQVASASTDPLAKASAEVRARRGSGHSQDVIVVFDDTAIQNEAENLQARTGVLSRHRSVIDYKARRFAEAKRSILSAFDSSEVTELKQYSHLPISFIRVHSVKALDMLLSNPGVHAVFDDKISQAAMLAQSLPLIGQPQAAAAGDIGSGTAVAVLDKRVDFRLPAFGSCTSSGFPSGCKVVVQQDVADLADDGLGYQDGHGTNVAATVLAVAPGSKVVSLNVFNGTGASNTDVINAINWCIANVSVYNIVAINLSLGSGRDTAPSTASPYYAPFVHARAAGILPVAAAGNSGYTNAIFEPASVVGAVSVGAVYDAAFGPYTWPELPTCADSATASDKVACFSNSASFLTLLAPGCRDDGGDSTHCGTSQAAPHVAGAVAVLRSAYPLETLDQTVSRLISGVSVTDPRNGVAKPRLSLPMALGLPSCTYSLSTTSLSIDAIGTTAGNISIANAKGCSWTASSNANWIRILYGGSGTGSGIVQYSVDANAGASARTGTLSIAGQTVAVVQPGGATSLSSATKIWLVGNYSVQWSDLNTATFNVDQIFHSGTNTTGPLRLDLYLSTVPFALGVAGWRVATYQITGTSNGTLGPNEYVSNVSSAQPLGGLPAPGSYYASLVVSEYSSACGTTDHFCVDAFGGLTDRFFIPDVTAPTTPTGVTTTTITSTQVNIIWNPSSDDVGVTAYKIYSNGVLLGSVSLAAAKISNLLPATIYQFTVSACDAIGNCSPKSAPLSASTLSTSSTPASNTATYPYLSRLSDYAQSIVKLLAIDFGVGSTNDLVNAGVSAYAAGASDAMILNILFDNAAIASSYPKLGSLYSDSAFVTQLINIIIGPVSSSTMAKSKSAWIAQYVAELGVAGAYASRGAFAVYLNSRFNPLTTLASGSDAYRVQQGILNRYEAAAYFSQSAYGSTFTSMTQVMVQVATVTDDVATLNAMIVKN